MLAAIRAILRVRVRPSRKGLVFLATSGRRAAPIVCTVIGTHPGLIAVSISMPKHIPVLLLGLVLAALLCDMILHLRPVHAQGPLTVYIDSAPHHFKERHDTLGLKGTEVIGFHCADGSCYVLSK
jgi:hypothetical protein